VPFEGGAAPSRDQDEMEGGDRRWRRRRRRRRRSSARSGQGSMPALTPEFDSQRRPPGATGTPGGRSSDGLDDLAASQAACADADPLGSAIHDRPHRHQVRQPPARGDVVRVTDLVAHDGALPAYITALGHFLDSSGEIDPAAIPVPERAGLPPSNAFLYHGVRGETSLAPRTPARSLP
jgi:hypothetical protein